LLPQNGSFLLAVPVRVQYMPGMHARKFLGDVLQRHHLAVPGLRPVERVGESVRKDGRIDAYYNDEFGFL